MQLTFEPADFDDPELTAFLRQYLADLAPESPRDSQHALDPDDLRSDHVRVRVARLDGTIVATGALAELEPGHEELKSMRVDPTLRGQGFGRRMVDHLVADADARGVQRISLETGSADFFAPARNLYRSMGFEQCEPFDGYHLDPHSAYFTRALRTGP